jgi:hypothetical protein
MKCLREDQVRKGLMQISYTNNSIINFQKTGEGKNTFIFSPFIPFPNKMMEDFFKNIGEKQIKMIFSEMDTSTKRLTKNLNFNNLIFSYSTLLDSINDGSNIILVGFGFFSILFLKLLIDYKDKINTAIFFEPDFMNSILMRTFEDEKKGSFSNYRALSSFFINNKKNNLNISKKNLKYFKIFYYNIKKYINENEIMKDIINIRSKIMIFWKIMENESCPLPQIFEENEINTFSFKENIYKSFIENDSIILNEINKKIK